VVETSADAGRAGITSRAADVAMVRMSFFITPPSLAIRMTAGPSWIEPP
jgi:hypothetical protein